MQTAKADRTPDLRPFFDFTKAAAILGVFSLHFYDIYLGYSISVEKILRTGILRYLSSDQSIPGGLLCSVLKGLSAFGGIGVSLFIIASGFGLYYSHLSSTAGWGRFYRKRFIRVLPLFYLGVLVSVLVDIFVYRSPYYATAEGLKSIAFNLLLLHPFSMKYSIASAFVFVGIIVQLYLLFPFLIKVFRYRFLPYLLFALSCASPSVSTAAVKLVYPEFDGVIVLDYLPYFLFGMLLAESAYNGRRLHGLLLGRAVSILSVAGLMAMVYLTSYYIEYFPFGQLIMSFLVFLSLPLLFEAALFTGFRRVIGYLSFASYSTYLFHMHFIRLGQDFFLSRMPSADSSSLGFLYLGLLLAALMTSYLIQSGYERIIKGLRGQ